MRPILLALTLSACATSPATLPLRQSPPQSVDSRGLPLPFVVCVRDKAKTMAGVYDVFDACRFDLVLYVARIDSMTQEQKAQFWIALERRAVNFAQDAVLAVHGSAARF